MNYNKLRYFYTAALTLNFTKAAEELYLSQPVLSRHISDLENDLQAKLFIRTNRNLTLTAAGKALFEECSPFYSREPELYKIVHEAAIIDAPSLKVCMMGTGLSYRLPEIREHYTKAAPGVELHYERSTWDGVLRSVEKGKADIGIKVSVFEEYPDDIDRYVVKKDSISIVAPAGHRLVSLPEASLEMIRHESIVMLERSDSRIPHDITLRLFSEAGIEPNIVGYYPNVEMALLMVQAGVGIMVLSPLAPITGLVGLVSIPLANSPPITLDIIWKKGKRNAAIDTFIETVKTFEW